MSLTLEHVTRIVDHQLYIDDACLSFEPGSFNVLLGRTLSGKTSLMRLMAGLDKPSSGRILMNGADMTNVSVRQRNVSMVYQQFINYPTLTVFENIASPLRQAGVSKAEILEKVHATAKMLRIEGLLKRYPLELSGGQQQRTAMARALVKDASLILFDEPLVNLDYKLREELRQEMRELFQARHTIAIYATTEPNEALALGELVGGPQQPGQPQADAQPEVRRWYYWPTWPLRMLGKALRGLMLLVMTLLTLVFRLVSRALAFAFKPLLVAVQWLLTQLERAYRSALQAALNFKAVTIAITLAVAAGCFALLPRLGADVIPAMSQGEFFVEVQLPVGSAIEQTDKVLTSLAAIAAEQTVVKRSYAQAGTGAQMTVDPSIGGSHWGRLNIVLQPGSSAEQEQQVITTLRDYLARQPDIMVKIDRPQLFSFSTPLEVELSGYELPQLKTAADNLVAALEADDRFTDVKTSLRRGQPEITLYFNHSLLSQLGMTSHDVAKRVAAYVGGELAGQYSVNDRKVDIRVRLEEQYRQSEQQLAQLIINPGSDKPLPLSAVAEIKRETGPSEITRIGQQRVAVVSANLAYGDLEQATQSAQTILSAQRLPYGVSAAVMGQSEEMERAYTSLTMALLLAVFLVYLVMASQFENLLQPLLILFTVPLAGAGAILGLWLTDTRLSVIVFIGLIMLAGIVVNNAIVLIDRINQLRGEGVALQQAIIEAGASRLRPVLMTTLTTILGLLPMALGTGDGSEIRAPMAITVIFGLALATMLTLLFIPVLYALVSRDAPVIQENRNQEISV